ncbi:MAG: TetR/AcrR family transcriptional regulator [Thermoleophilia bacterium]|nr:TetR/AcrR family transcriptional regulator [Thermoleophilia bacterium]
MAVPTDPPAPRRPRMTGADRRVAILASARAAFAEKGFQGAGTAAISRAAGCSEAILYRHFDSKRALLLAVLEEEITSRVREGRAIAPSGGAESAAAMPAALEARLADPEMVVTIRLILLALSISGDPEVSAAVGRLFETVRAPVRRMLEAGQAAGRVRGDLDPELLTWLWHGLFLVALVRTSIADDGVALGAVDAARLLAGLLGPPPAD